MIKASEKHESLVEEPPETETEPESAAPMEDVDMDDESDVEPVKPKPWPSRLSVPSIPTTAAFDPRLAALRIRTRQIVCLPVLSPPLYSRRPFDSGQRSLCYAPHRRPPAVIHPIMHRLA